MPRRPAINPNVRIAVWAAAAARCTFCNTYLLESEDLGLEVPIGELAHIVGWGQDSPRGDTDAAALDRSKAENLVLLCRNCHKPIDNEGYVGVYDEEQLRRLKADHEARIRFLTEIAGDRHATLVRVVGPIRNVNPELSYETVLEAVARAGFFPALLPNAHRREIELDFRQQLVDHESREAVEAAAAQVQVLAGRISDGIRHDEIHRLAVFGFARIPLLVQLGAQLDDKVVTMVFQRQRIDAGNPWCWPVNPGPVPAFQVNLASDAPDGSPVALVMDVSGVIAHEDLPKDIARTHFVYRLSVQEPSGPHPGVIDSPAALASFESTLRIFLAGLEGRHGRLDRLSILPALPVSCAVTLGRVLMPNVSPSLAVYDRTESGIFFESLIVSR